MPSMSLNDVVLLKKGLLFYWYSNIAIPLEHEESENMWQM